MSRLQITDVGPGMRITNKHNGMSGTVIRNDQGRLRVKLDSGKRIDVIADESGEIRWSVPRGTLFSSTKP